MNDVTPTIFQPPCRVSDMSEETYRAHSGLSQSMLRLLKKSPAHLLRNIISPPPVSDEMAFGSATHDYLLGSHSKKRFVVRPEELSAYTKEGKLWKQKQKDDGLVVISKEQMSDISGMGESLGSNSEMAAVLSGANEVSMFANVEIGDRKILMKGRADCLPRNSNTIFDIKTCASCEDINKLTWTIHSYSYAIQAALYLFLARETTPNDVEPPTLFCFCFIERTAPYAFRRVLLSESWIASAETEWRELASLYSDCLENNSWPSYPAVYTVLNCPSTSGGRYVAEIFE